jgi:hypothetical protein
MLRCSHKNSLAIESVPASARSVGCIMTSFEQVSEWTTDRRSAPELLQASSKKTIPGRVFWAMSGGRFAASACRLLRGDTTVALLTAFVLALTFLTIPRIPLSNGMESSWGAVLSYAHQRGLLFGTDIVYTYGPLGFLTISHFTGDVTGLRLAVDTTLCFGVAAGVCLLAWRLRIGWRLLTIAIFTLVTANVQEQTQDLLINIGLLCWGLLCACESRPRLRIYVLCLVLLAIFSALTKVTGLVLASFTVSAIAADLSLRGCRRLSVMLVLGFIVGFLGGWAALGQTISHIPAFLAGGLGVSGGYNGAMGLEPGLAALTGGLLTLFTALAAALTRCWVQEESNIAQRWRQRLLLAWLLLLIFVTWKHGFVRADLHHAIFFVGFAPVMALVLEALPWPTLKPSRWTGQLAGACCLCAILTLQSLLYPDFLHLERPFRQAAANAAALLWPGAYREHMERSLRLERHRASLPRLREKIGSAPVDVFGNFQAYAVFNELNYRPRPVFQSYSAYSAPLMRLNERFYSSSAAPEFVLAKLGTIDDRLPVLEDAFAFRYLLRNYEPIGNEGGFLLLKSRASVTPEVTMLRQGTVRAGEPIDLKSYGQSDIWLEIDLQPTAAGRLRKFFYQPPLVRLWVWDGMPARPTKQFRAPAPIMAAGFLASPLVLSNEGLLDLYAGKTVARPSAYSVEIAPSSGFLWQGTIPYQLYRIENTKTRPLVSRQAGQESGS